jgi:hypothetical protein
VEVTTVEKLASKAWIQQWIAAREREHLSAMQRAGAFLERHRAFHAAVTQGEWTKAHEMVVAEREHQRRGELEARQARETSESQLRAARAVAS